MFWTFNWKGESEKNEIKINEMRNKHKRKLIYTEAMIFHVT